MRKGAAQNFGFEQSGKIKIAGELRRAGDFLDSIDARNRNSDYVMSQSTSTAEQLKN